MVNIEQSFENAADPPGLPVWAFRDIQDHLAIRSLLPRFVPLFERPQDIIETFIDHSAEKKQVLKTLVILDNAHPELFTDIVGQRLYGHPANWPASQTPVLKDLVHDITDHATPADFAQAELALDIATFESNLRMLQNPASRSKFFNSFMVCANRILSTVSAADAITAEKDEDYKRTLIHSAVIAKYSKDVSEQLLVTTLNPHYYDVPRLVKEQSRLGAAFLRALVTNPESKAALPQLTLDVIPPHVRSSSPPPSSQPRQSWLTWFRR